MIFFSFFFYAHFKCATIFNFLTEPDTDIFIENKKIPYGQFSTNIVTNLYRVHVCACACAYLCVCLFVRADFSDTIRVRKLKF